MKIALVRNSQDQSKSIPYHVHIELSPFATTEFETEFDIPIRLKWVGGRNQYIAEICGFHMEADSPQSVLNLVNKVTPTLVNFKRMPTYMFIARHTRKVYPVYTKADEVITVTTPGGPVVRHVELAVIRDRATAYLNKARVLGKPGQLEKLHVRGVHQKSLKLIRPIFYLKKRPQDSDENEFWAPVFPSDGNLSIYTYAASAKRETAMDNGQEVFRLRSVVAQALIDDNRLKEDFDLRADRLLPGYWKKVYPLLEILPQKLAYNDVRLDIYRGEEHIIAVEDRHRENRFSFYLGNDLEDVRRRAGIDLARRGIIDDTEAVSTLE